MASLLNQLLLGLRPLVLYQPVRLVGSAPHLLRRIPPRKTLVCVNGSALGIGNANADITFLNSSLLVQNTPIRIETSKRLKNLKAGWVVFIDAAELGCDPPYDDYVGAIHITKIQRCQILEEITGWKLEGTGGDFVPSTGFFAALCLYAAGCRSLQLQGFSFEGGHNYFNKHTPREHLLMDIKSLEFLRQNCRRFKWLRN